MSFQLIIQTVLLMVAVSASTMVVGMWTALGAMLVPRSVRHGMVLLAILNLVLPQFLVLTWWMGLLGEAGSLRPWLDWNLYSTSGAVWVLTLLFWPIPFLLALGRFQRMDASWMESDAELRNWNLCRHLLWPVAKPALLAGGIMVALLTLNQFNVPSLLQVKTWTADLFVTFSATLDWREIVPSIGSLVLVSMVGLFLFRGREVHWPLGAGHPSQRHLSHALDPWLASLLTWTAIGWVLLATVFPLLGSLMTRSTWQSLASATAAGQSAWQHSFAFALGTATACLLLGIATWRWRPGRFFWIFFLLPGCVWGVLLLSLSQQSWFPQRGSSLGLTFVALVFRYGILGWLGMRLAMQSLDRDIRDTGRLEIPSAIQRFRCLYAPLVGWLLLASWYVVYLLSLWDADTLLFVIPPGAETLALRIFNLLHYGHNTQVHALILLLMSTALLPWLGWQLWRGVKPLMQRIRPVPMLSLLLGVLGWSFLSACSPEVTSEDSPQTKLDSRFFDQAIIIGTQGRSPGYFIKPRSLTVDAHDFLYVVDMTGRVQKFDPDGQYVLQWQMPELERGRPKGMCVDAEGHVVVVEPHYARVNHFSPEGDLIRQWGVKGKETGSLTFPRAVAMQSTGNLVVSEYQAVERIQRFTPDGSTCLGAVGVAGQDAGQFNRPEGLACDEDDAIFVADSCNHRIQVLDEEGTWLRSFGKAGQGQGELSYPYDLVVDDEGYLFVCEFGNSRLQVFDREGKSVELLGGPGDAPGQFNNPWSIAMDSKGHLYVADSANHRVQKLIRKDSARPKP